MSPNFAIEKYFSIFFYLFRYTFTWILERDKWENRCIAKDFMNISRVIYLRTSQKINFLCGNIFLPFWQANNEILWKLCSEGILNIFETEQFLILFSQRYGFPHEVLPFEACSPSFHPTSSSSNFIKP